MHYNMTFNKMVPFTRWNVYHYFCSDNRERVKLENPEANFLEINRILGKMWSKNSRDYYSKGPTNIRIGNDVWQNVNIAVDMGMHTRNGASWDEIQAMYYHERGVCDWVYKKGTAKGTTCVKYCKKNSTRCFLHASRPIQEVLANNCEWVMRSGPRKGQLCDVKCVINLCNTHAAIETHEYKKKRGAYTSIKPAPDEGTSSGNTISFNKRYPTWERKIAQAINGALPPTTSRKGKGRGKIASRQAIKKYLIAMGVNDISYLNIALRKYTGDSFIKVKGSYKLSCNLKKRLQRWGDI